MCRYILTECLLDFHLFLFFLPTTLNDVFTLSWQLTGAVLLCEKRQKRKEVRLTRLGGGVRDVGRELAAASVSASPGLVHCRQGPSALPLLLSAGSAAAKKRLNKALFICADCIHCTSQPLGCGTTQICPALQRKGRQTCSQQQSA